MKKISIVFIVLCLSVCIVPFAGMAVKRSDSSTEKRRLAEFPEISEDGKLNTNYLPQLGAYFEDHFAFRNELVNTNSLIKAKLFATSAENSVILGKDGWLYYRSTLDDHAGTNLMSPRAIFNASNNLRLMRDFVESNGAEFLLTVPPNKNSLYSENMPYYLKGRVSEEKNITAFEKAVSEFDIKYADLFRLFEQEDELLYLKRDSHWNNKGAYLAYDEILSALGKEHFTYSPSDISRRQDSEGDLNRMLFPLTPQPEWDYEYKTKPFSCVGENVSVEDASIETFSDSDEGSLVMYRDSFTNTLLPFIAPNFSVSFFSKAVPYDLEYDISARSPDTVIVEKVERNIKDFASSPPVMTAPQVSPGKCSAIGSETSVSASQSLLNADYIEITGEIDPKVAEDDMRIFAEINGDLYEAFTVSTVQTDFAYTLYLKNGVLNGGPADIRILISSGDTFKEVCNSTLDAIN